MSSRFRADWVLPIADPVIPRGSVVVDRGGIQAVEIDRGDDHQVEAVELGRAVILPALVNAHTHLELSYLRGRIPPARRLVDWVRALMAARREAADAAEPSDPRILDAARDAVAEARATGTVLIGEVTNSLVTVPILKRAGMAAQVFHELIGFGVTEPAARMARARVEIEASAACTGVDVDADAPVRISLAPHAPYSVSPALFTAIRADLDASRRGVSTVHLGESPEEVEFLRRGTGPWRMLLEELGVWTDAWTPPDASPVTYLSDLGFLDRRVLAVHGVQFDGEDLSRIRALGVTVVSCPRSNQYVGVGAPPIESFYAMDVDVAFGTDSLASAPDVNLFAELAEARRLAPRVPARRLLESATLIGARALGFDDTFGSIEPGKRAALLAVRVPEGVTDVEEYLVSGIPSSAIAWIDTGGRSAGAEPA